MKLFFIEHKILIKFSLKQIESNTLIKFINNNEINIRIYNDVSHTASFARESKVLGTQHFPSRKEKTQKIMKAWIQILIINITKKYI
jgi:hypothetical protein